MRQSVRTLVLALAALAVGFVWAQGATDDPQLDAAFVAAAAQGDQYEIASSELALEHAASEEVRTFAQQMIDDHTLTSEQLTQVADTLGLQPPLEPAATHVVKLARLMEFEGDAFDRVYAMQQVIVHQDAVNLFRAAAEHAEDDELRAFANQHLPALESHLQMAMEIADSLP